MKCPHCENAELLMSDRQGVEIDYCPQCRGVWLDRGELDKLIERSATVSGAAQAGAHGGQAPRRSDYDGSDHRGGYRKQKSWLSEIFD